MLLSQIELELSGNQDRLLEKWQMDMIKLSVNGGYISHGSEFQKGEREKVD